MTDQRVLPDVTHEEFERMRSLGAANELHRAIVSLALNDSDRQYVETACMELSGCPDEFVRGNAILGFGHLARRFGQLSSECRQIIERGLQDPSLHVRGQAWAAADDAVFFLKWSIAGFDPGNLELGEDEGADDDEDRDESIRLRGE